MSGVFKKLFPCSSLLASGLSGFRLQESIFVVLDLFLLAFLLVFHSLFSSSFGNPSRALVFVLAIGFFLRPLELMWLHGLRELPSRRSLTLISWVSIAFDLALALTLSILSNSNHSPYLVLMIVPILQTALRSGVVAVAGVVATASVFAFLPVWFYFRHHSPVEVVEYLQAAISSSIFAIVGFLVWLLVRDVREREADLVDNLLELYQNRDKLLEEEKLAALGRWSNAIAQEIGNPVAQISTSLVTARQLTGREQEEKNRVAAEEAARLSRLISDFLAYAHLQPPKLMPTSVPDAAHGSAEVCSVHASQKGVHLQLETSEALIADADPDQLQQAVVNLITNAVEACSSGSVVRMKVYGRDHTVCLDIENPGNPIPELERSQIFEPFFTTKPSGTGLGLAIARQIARVHGGDVTLAANEPDRICFSLTLPTSNGKPPRLRTKSSGKKPTH